MTFQTLATETLDANGPSWANYTIRLVIDSAQLSGNGGNGDIRITVVSATSGQNLEIDKCYIGHAASSGDAYDFESTPTQITWDTGSATTGLISVGGNTKVSDGVAFDVDVAKDLVIAMHIKNDTSRDDVRRTNATSTGWSSYYKAAGDDTATVDATGYTTLSGSALLVTLVELDVGLTPSATADAHASGIAPTFTSYDTRIRLKVPPRQTVLTTRVRNETNESEAYWQPRTIVLTEEEVIKLTGRFMGGETIASPSIAVTDGLGNTESVLSGSNTILGTENITFQTITVGAHGGQIYNIYTVATVNSQVNGRTLLARVAAKNDFVLGNFVREGTLHAYEGEVLRFLMDYEGHQAITSVSDMEVYRDTAPSTDIAGTVFSSATPDYSDNLLLVPDFTFQDGHGGSTYLMVAKIVVDGQTRIDKVKIRVRSDVLPI